MSIGESSMLKQIYGNCRPAQQGRLAEVEQSQEGSQLGKFCGKGRVGRQGGRVKGIKLG
jgi:hypothetical protein